MQEAASEAVKALIQINPPNLDTMAIKWTGSPSPDLRNHALNLLPKIITKQSFRQLLIEMVITPAFVYSEGLHTFIHQNISMGEYNMLTAMLNAKSVDMQYLAAVELMDSKGYETNAYADLIPAFLRVMRKTVVAYDNDRTDRAEIERVQRLRHQEARRRLDELITEGLYIFNARNVFPFVTGNDMTARYATRILLCTENESVLKEAISQNPANECEGLFDEISELYFSEEISEIYPSAKSYFSILRCDREKTALIINPYNSRWISTFFSSKNPRNQVKAARIMARFGDTACIKPALDLIRIKEKIQKYGFFGPEVEIRPYYRDGIKVLEELWNAISPPYEANALVELLTSEKSSKEESMTEEVRIYIVKLIAKSENDLSIEKILQVYPEGDSGIGDEMRNFLENR